MQNFDKLKIAPFLGDMKVVVPEMISKPDPKSKDTYFIVKYNLKIPTGCLIFKLAFGMF